MKTVKDILDTKGRHVLSLDPGATVYDGLKLMAEKEIGALLVMEGDRVLGIMSERDYARKVILLGKSSRELTLADIMTHEVVCVREEQNVEECMALMTGRRFRHLPVIENNKVVGVISIGDVVRAIIEDKQYMIEQLENYITGCR
jgi:CBS domain-containing protein